MDFISQLLLKIYQVIGEPILLYISNIQDYTTYFIIFIIFATIGYIIAKATIFILRIIFNYTKLNEIQKKNPELFYGINISNLTLSLVKYYIILYFLILGIVVDFPSYYYLFYILNLVYTAIIILLVGIIIGDIIAYLFNIKNNVAKIVKGTILYLFLIIALSYLGLNSTVLVQALYYLLLSAAISFGIMIGVIIALEYKDEIIKIIK
ncbi:putative membrane protein [Candidatus Nanobsidianus stetteri]|uniref:Putative membrane protein n=1 Tax=Nanobsidianus stetteri TaxID=1294122 RepID=R1E4W9_NANST|nr:putative membrane protein [Candidatus Nanobsidianus stetteri]